MRLDLSRLKEITGKEQPAAQARWFMQKYGVNLAYDRHGVILTNAAFEGLVARQCGLLLPANQENRPVVRLVRRTA